MPLHAASSRYQRLFKRGSESAPTSNVALHAPTTNAFVAGYLGASVVASIALDLLDYDTFAALMESSAGLCASVAILSRLGYERIARRALLILAVFVGAI